MENLILVHWVDIDRSDIEEHCKQIRVQGIKAHFCSAAARTTAYAK